MKKIKGVGTKIEFQSKDEQLNLPFIWKAFSLSKKLAENRPSVMFLTLFSSLTK
jgi:hypothetical protein